MERLEKVIHGAKGGLLACADIGEESTDLWSGAAWKPAGPSRREPSGRQGAGGGHRLLVKQSKHAAGIPRQNCASPPNCGVEPSVFCSHDITPTKRIKTKKIFMLQYCGL